MDWVSQIRTIPDFPKPGIQFKDITPLLQDPKAFAAVTDLFVERYKSAGVTAIVGIESRGFIFGAALAMRLGVAFVPVRKKGKLPAKTIAATYDLEYGSATIEIHTDALKASDKVVVLDDLLATGGTLAAACSLVEKLGARIHEVATVVELSFLDGRSKLGARPYHSLCQF